MVQKKCSLVKIQNYVLVYTNEKPSDMSVRTYIAKGKLSYTRVLVYPPKEKFLMSGIFFNPLYQFPEFGRATPISSLKLSAFAIQSALKTFPSISKQRGNGAILGTGWISELNPRKGVLTFEYGGRDERVLFLASKVYIFEKRLGARQNLSDVITEGDPVQFEAVPQQQPGEDSGVNGTSSNLYCTWFANLVWKGRRPPGVEDAPTTTSSQSGSSLLVQARRGSLQEDDAAQSNTGSSAASNALVAPAFNGFVSENFIKGVGVIAKILNEKSGIVWWLKTSNNLQSVWFEAKQSFMYGCNLADKNLFDVFKEGEGGNK
jgi:hypothetical protein